MRLLAHLRAGLLGHTVTSFLRSKGVNFFAFQLLQVGGVGLY